MDWELSSTEELRRRAFAAAVRAKDFGFFWSVFKHLPAAADVESLDSSMASIGLSIADLTALWQEFTGHGYGAAEPLLRAAFVDYLIRHGEHPE